MTQINKRKVISDSFFLSGLTLISKLKAIIFLPTIIATIGISYYGIFQQILMNVLLLYPFFSLGLGNAFHRFTSKIEDDDQQELSVHWWTVIFYTLLSAIIGALTLIILAPIISSYILEGEALDSLYLSSILVLINVQWYICISYLQARRRFKLFSVIEFLYQFLPYLGFVVGVLVNKKIFLGILIFTFLKGLILGFIFIRICTKLQLVRPSRKLFKEFLKFSMPLSFSHVSGGVLDKMDRYFIGYFLGNYLLGVYNIIYSAAVLIDAVSIPFRRYIASYLPKLWDNNELNTVRQQIREALLYYCVIGLFFVFALVAYLETFLQILLGRSFGDVENLTLTLFAIAVGIFLFGANKFFFQYIKLYKNTLLQLYIYILGVVINIVLNVLLIPYIGIFGAGLATLISYLSTLMLSNHCYSLTLRKKFWLKILLLLLTSIFAYFFGTLFLDTKIITLIISGMLYTITYFLLLFLFNILSIEKLKRRFC